MGDIIDDFMQIKKELDKTESTLSGTFDDLSGKTPSGARGIAEIWDPTRYAVHPQMNVDLCFHSHSEDATCTACSDVCPVGALSIVDHNMSIASKDCIGCGLCVPVCPTSALVASPIEPRKLYDSIAAASQSGEMAYVTCARALKKNPPAGMVVLPCVGDMTRQLWFSLLAPYANIAIYLPIDVCDDCPCNAGEEMYGEAVMAAEKWANETVGFECDESDLVLERKHEEERKEFIKSMFSSGINLATKANPITAQANRAIQTLTKHRNELTRIQNLLDVTVGQKSEEFPKVLEPNRQLVLGALNAYKDLADSIKIDVAVTGEGCTQCRTCMKTCPLGARQMEQGEVITLTSYCIGCGFCAQVCPTGACTMEEKPGSVLVREMTDMEKKVADLKEKATDVAGQAKERITSEVGDDEKADKPSE